MLISTPSELRLYIASHALDDIASVQGVLALSERDFLADKLGASLYDALIAYYRELSDTDVAAFVEKATTGSLDLTPAEQLLQLCQRCVAYDALARHVDIHALSVNSAGINVSEADDYKKPDNTTLANFKAAAVRESHASVNMLLQQLERWCKEYLEQLPEGTEPTADTEAYYASLWKADSRYYYLAAQLIFPTAVVLNDYLNIYDSREKYVSLLPTIRTIQEDLIEPVLGEDVVAYLVANASVYHAAAPSTVLDKTIHRVRKAAASFLEEHLLRSKPGTTTQGAVLNAYQNAITRAHDEGINRLTSAITALEKAFATIDSDFLDVLVTSPMADRFDLTKLSDRTDLSAETEALVDAAVEAATYDGTKETDPDTVFENNTPGKVLFAFPAIH